jgi:hypothetical protein
MKSIRNLSTQGLTVSLTLLVDRLDFVALDAICFAEIVSACMTIQASKSAERIHPTNQQKEIRETNNGYVRIRKDGLGGLEGPRINGVLVDVAWCDANRAQGVDLTREGIELVCLLVKVEQRRERFMHIMCHVIDEM